MADAYSMGSSMVSDLTVDDDRFTAIAEFDVEPEQHRSLLDVLTTETERWVRDRPGFVAASFLEDTECSHVVVYTRWEERGDWETFCQDPEHAVLNDKLSQLGIGETFDGRPHDLHEVIETAPPRPWP
jgi:heme-degrading monooxygenase HmoA